MRVPFFEEIADGVFDPRPVVEHAADVEEVAIPRTIARDSRLREHLHADLAELCNPLFELDHVRDEADQPEPVRLDFVGVVHDRLAHVERRLRRLAALDLPQHVVQRSVYVLLWIHDREQQMIVKHLRIALQRRQYLREVLYGLVILEQREAGDLVDHAGVELADDLDSTTEVGPELVACDPELLFGRDHLQVRVGPGVREPFEVAFDHGPFEIGVFQELVDHGGVGLDAERLTLRVVLARRVRDRVFERLPGVDRAVRRIERFERGVHPRAGLQRPHRAVQSRREAAHVPKPVPATASLKVLQVRLRDAPYVFHHSPSSKSSDSIRAASASRCAVDFPAA